MHDSRLIHTLKAFNPIEWKHFHEFTESAYFNRGGRGGELLAYLERFASDWSHPDLAKEVAFTTVFPGKPFHKQTLLDEMSHLFRLAKSFLANEELKAQPEQLELLALTQLRKKQVLPVQKVQLNAIHRRLEQAPFLDDHLLALKHQWSRENNVYKDLKTGRKTEESLEQKIEALDQWYIYIKLRDSCELLNRNNIFKKESEFPLLPEIQNHLAQHPKRFANVPALMLHQQVFSLLSEPDNTDHYLLLVASLEENISALSAEQAKMFYTYAQNVCIHQMNQGSSFFSSELLRLYKTQLSKGLLTTGNSIVHTTYTNVVSTALKFREYEWVEEFMLTYKPYLPAEKREAVYTHNLAAFYFEQQKWREAIRLLRDLNYADTFYEISARVLLCKTYFAQQDWEALGYLMDTFARSLKRNKVLSPSNRTHYLNFLKYLKRIARLHERAPMYTHKEMEERTKKISGVLAKAAKVSNLQWLRECMVNPVSP